ncbi:SART-1 family protein DOT2 [Diplogelasinospora grovesii]|uniref:SART-1 family protein DOT2 n=1 Tax=Diplogelasinospora grovesii TaxID=303347 RepID=A0AAN6ND15_9PEZI|nr:SART-1 family protein DOT2 [Diplogelasinospora grovesii]
MDAASIEEINKLRKAMGMKPLPVPGAAPEQKGAPENEEDVGSTLATREAAAYDNYRQVQEAEAAKKKREEKAAAIKKAREKAQRFAVLEGKGIADLDDDDADLDAKSWLKSQKKRQKKIQQTEQEKAEKEAAEAAAAAAAQHTAEDLAGVKVGHDLTSFLDADDQILTLKDTGVLEEDEGDELENLSLREQEKLQERLDLKRKKPLYDPNDVDATGSILAQYDEEIHGKKKKVFTLDAVGTSNELGDILDAAPVQRRIQRQVADLDELEDAPPPVSDYLDPSEVKVKKPKKKKSKSTRQKRDDDDVLFPGDQDAPVADDSLMDVDTTTFTKKKRKVADDDFADDDDLQTTLALQRKDALKKRRRTRPEDIAQQFREEASQPPESQSPTSNGEDATTTGKGIVIDEISEFVDALATTQDRDEAFVRKPKQPKPTMITSMEEEGSDEDEDQEMKDAALNEYHRDSHSVEPEGLAGLSAAGVEEEKTVDQGMGATLALLRDRKLIETKDKDKEGSVLNDRFRQRQLFLAELHKRMAAFDEDTRMQRERDRASGRLDRMSIREKEEWQRQQNTIRDQHQARIMDQLFREGYKPNIELKYIDADGRSLDAKEAFKELSHQFHGKGSGKGKTDKKLKKLAEEKRRMAQSVLDASQNVGMSSAATQQGKKRKEAGVRLA